MTSRKLSARSRAAKANPSTLPNKGPARALRLSRVTPETKKGPEPGANSAAAVVSDLIVLGYDGEGKPRAARFTDADPDLVAKAAVALNLEVRPATSAEVAKVAKRLPVGRLYANGTGFVPNVRHNLYSDVIAALAVEGRASRAADSAL